MLKTRTFVSVLIEVADVSETKAEASARAVQRGALGDLHRTTLDRDVLRRRRYPLKQDSGKVDNLNDSRRRNSVLNMNNGYISKRA